MYITNNKTTHGLRHHEIKRVVLTLASNHWKSNILNDPWKEAVSLHFGLIQASNGFQGDISSRYVPIII